MGLRLREGIDADAIASRFGLARDRRLARASTGWSVRAPHARRRAHRADRQADAWCSITSWARSPRASLRLRRLPRAAGWRPACAGCAGAAAAAFCFGAVQSRHELVIVGRRRDDNRRSSYRHRRPRPCGSSRSSCERRPRALLSDCICTVQAPRRYSSIASGATFSLVALVVASLRHPRNASVGALIDA